MNVVRWSPYRELELLQRGMRAPLGDGEWLPSTGPVADFYETPSDVVVELELAGYDEKEIEIETIGRQLRIAGSRSEITQDGDEKAFHVRERRQRSFEQRFELPVEADLDRVSAAFDKGVLTIRAPKVEGAKPRKIEIGSAARRRMSVVESDALPPPDLSAPIETEEAKSPPRWKLWTRKA
jgi:HSP20 family protein